MLQFSASCYIRQWKTKTWHSLAENVYFVVILLILKDYCTMQRIHLHAHSCPFQSIIMPCAESPQPATPQHWPSVHFHSSDWSSTWDFKHWRKQPFWITTISYCSVKTDTWQQCFYWDSSFATAVTSQTQLYNSGCCWNTHTYTHMNILKYTNK